MSIENLFNSPEKKNELKTLEREFNEGFLVINTLFVKYGIEGIDDLKKKLIGIYTAERDAIHKKYVNPDANIDFTPATRKRAKKNADTEEGDGTSVETTPAPVVADPKADAAAKKTAAAAAKKKNGVKAGEDMM